MIKSVLLSGVAAIALFAGPAMAFDASLTQAAKKVNTTTQATGSGGAQSGSNVIGGSAILGGTSIVTGNTSVAAGNVTSKSKPGNSSVTQTYATNSTSVLQGASLGLAGSVGASNGAAAVTGDGVAQTVKKTKINSVSLHVALF